MLTNRYRRPTEYRVREVRERRRVIWLGLELPEEPSGIVGRIAITSGRANSNDNPRLLNVKLCIDRISKWR